MVSVLAGPDSPQKHREHKGSEWTLIWHQVDGERAVTELQTPKLRAPISNPGRVSILVKRNIDGSVAGVQTASLPFDLSPSTWVSVTQRFTDIKFRDLWRTVWVHILDQYNHPVQTGSVGDRCKYLLRIRLTFNVRGHWDGFAVFPFVPRDAKTRGDGFPSLRPSPALSSTLVHRRGHRHLECAGSLRFKRELLRPRASSTPGGSWPA
jgi:hypothetical protein